MEDDRALGSELHFLDIIPPHLELAKKVSVKDAARSYLVGARACDEIQTRDYEGAKDQDGPVLLGKKCAYAAAAE